MSFNIVFILILLTLLTLVAGIVFMATGGKINQKYSNKLMSLRVAFQGIAILLLALIAFIAKK